MSWMMCFIHKSKATKYLIYKTAIQQNLIVNVTVLEQDSMSTYTGLSTA